MSGADPSWASLLPPLLAAASLGDAAIVDVTPLTGGVSSDIVRVDLSDGQSVVAKRALSQLRVADEWHAPVERNHYEIGWFRLANAIVPGSAPAILGEDRAHGIALMSYLPPDRYLLWKAELLAGRVAPGVAAAVADTIGRIHRGTLHDEGIAADFATDDLFDAIRLDPYLRTLAARHPEVASPILAALNATRDTRIALVHGDLSPKNILIRRNDAKPVILDAECAWYGDPVFDAAFCLNHLVLKAVHMPELAATLINEARAFFATWLSHLPASLRAGADARTAALLPCLMLARVDGKSPVEYLTEAGRRRVRDLSIPLIGDRAATTDEIFAAVAGVDR